MSQCIFPDYSVNNETNIFSVKQKHVFHYYLLLLVFGMTVMLLLERRVVWGHGDGRPVSDNIELGTVSVHRAGQVM